MNAADLMWWLKQCVTVEQTVVELLGGDEMGDLLVHMGITVLLATVKNAESKTKFKAAFLKVFRAIQDAFSGDPDFD